MADPKLQQLSQALDEAQAALDVEQQQVKDLLASRDQTITGLNGIITDLQAQVADGGSPADRQAVLDKIVALKADVEATVNTGGGDSPADTGGGNTGGGGTVNG